MNRRSRWWWRYHDHDFRNSANQMSGDNSDAIVGCVTLIALLVVMIGVGAAVLAVCGASYNGSFYSIWSGIVKAVVTIGTLLFLLKFCK